MRSAAAPMPAPTAIGSRLDPDSSVTLQRREPLAASKARTVWLASTMKMTPSLTTGAATMRCLRLEPAPAFSRHATRRSGPAATWPTILPGALPACGQLAISAAGGTTTVVAASEASGSSCWSSTDMETRAALSSSEISLPRPPKIPHPASIKALAARARERRVLIIGRELPGFRSRLCLRSSRRRGPERGAPTSRAGSAAGIRGADCRRRGAG